MKRLHQLLAATELANLAPHVAELEVAQLAYDARTVRGPALYAAWQGQRSDGHRFVAEAERRGAVCALTQRHVEGVTLPQLVCRDPRRVLARAARKFYDAPDAQLHTVAVTGTNGKTTCAQLLASVLAAWHGQAAALGTLGLRRYRAEAGAAAVADPAGPSAVLTTPEAPQLVASVRALVDDGVRAVALEASSIALDQGRLDGVRFDVAAWSNTTQDHLDYHGTFDAYAGAKARLFAEGLKSDGTAVLNGDDPYQKDVRGPRTLRFAAAPRGLQGAEADVYPLSGGAGRDGLRITVQTPRGALTLRSPLVGAFNVENLLLTVAVAEALGVPHAAVQAGVAALAGVDGRLERIVVPPAPDAASTTAARGAPLVVVDYAHTPDALARVLAALRPATSGRLWCVFGCGGDRDADKRPKMGAAVAAGAELAVVTNDNPRGEVPAAIAAAVAAGLDAAGATICPDVATLAQRPARGAGYAVVLDRAAAIADVVAAAAPHDTVLLAGKGHETTQTVGGVAHPFDDRVHARAALAAKKGAR